ncbi:MAG: chromosome segregation protein SMC, partial [Acidimicrobiales bacterium]
ARAGAALADARQAEAELARLLDDNDGRLGAAADALQRVEGQRAEVRAEAQSVDAHLGALRERAERDAAEADRLERWVPAAEAAEEAAAERGRRAEEVRRSLAERAAALRARRQALDVQAAGLEERRSILARRLGEIEDRLARTTSARREAAARRQGLEAAALATSRLAQVVEVCRGRLEAGLGDLGAERRARSAVMEAQASALSRLRQERVTLEAALAEVQERLQRAEIHRAEVRLRREAAVETLRRDLGAEAAAALAAPCPELAPGVSAAQRGRELDRELRLLGPVNPLAVAELEALSERARFLEGQLEDVRAARRELGKVIRAIDAEIVGVFAGAYADVSRHFSELVTTLFPGGAGSLSLTDPANLLETGIEVSARPAGKQVRKLSLLSGGERSLVALAFLCAVFRSRPSPFYLMDEVEAALDDVNLHRFLDLVHEFRADAQLIIVSHQKRTMEIADCLYGISMQLGGSSRVVSERVTVPAPAPA